MGRFFFGVCQRIDARWGHRGFVLSLVLWVPCFVLVWIHPLVGWVVWGALSHVLLDTCNLAGVQLFWPSTRRAVFGGRSVRLRVNGTGEMVLMVIFFAGVWGAYKIQEIGGWRSLAGITGSYEVAAQSALRAGSEAVVLRGTWRSRGGTILKDKEYLVVGRGGVGRKVRWVLWDSEDRRLLRPYLDVYPLNVRARKAGWKWGVVQIGKPVEAVGDLFYQPFAGGRWGAAFAGDILMGVVKWRIDPEGGGGEG